MNANFSVALSRILASEAGFRVASTEPGGAVNNGITMQLYAAWCQKQGRPVPTIDDLKNLSEADTKAIYQQELFTPVRFDDLPSGVDYAMVDFAVNSGIAGALNAVRFLFSIGFSPTPWRMDDALLSVLKDANPVFAASAICDLRWARMQVQSDFAQPSAVVPGKIIGNGRAFRMSAVHRGAMEMLGFPAEPDKYTAPGASP